MSGNPYRHNNTFSTNNGLAACIDIGNTQFGTFPLSLTRQKVLKGVWVVFALRVLRD
jgi:hypothetical protein